MPKTFPIAVRNKALELYLQGHSSKDIADSLRIEFSNNVTQSTVYAWIKEGEWELKKNENYTNGLVKIQETEGQKLNRIQQEHWDNYGDLRQKAIHELEHLPFDKASDAAKALDLGIRGERQVMEGLVNLQFVQSVLEVLVDEIKDEEVLRRIALKLKTLIRSEETKIV